MADLADLKRRAEEARRFRHTVEGGPTFVVCMPTKHEFNLEFLRHKSDGLDNTGAWVATERALLERAVVGWQDISTTDLVPDAQPEPLPFDSDVVSYLFDDHPDWYVSLSRALAERMEARTAVKDSAAKN